MEDLQFIYKTQYHVFEDKINTLMDDVAILNDKIARLVSNNIDRSEIKKLENKIKCNKKLIEEYEKYECWS